MLNLLQKNIATTIKINGRGKMMKPVKLLLQTNGMDYVYCYFSLWLWLAVKARHHNALEIDKSELELKMRNLHQKQISVFLSCNIHPGLNQFVTRPSNTAHILFF